MTLREDHNRIKALLTEAITVLCKNGLGYTSEFCIDGLLGITVDKEDVFLVKIHETISRQKPEEERTDKAVPANTREENHPASDSPTSTLSLSQSPTLQNVTHYHRANSHSSETGSPSSESVRKRPPDQDSPPQAAKRRAGDSSSEPIVIKQEVINDSEFQEFNALSGETMNNMRQNLLARQENYGIPSTSRWPEGTINESSSSSASNFQTDADMVRPEQSDGQTRTREEPLDYTVTDDRRLEHQLRLNASAAEAAQLALLQHQKSILQAMPGMSPSAAGMWQHVNPDYLRMQHKMARPYVCEECGKTFTSSCGRRRHMDTHRGIYPYRCEHCGKGFTASNNLKAHMTLHTNVNNFKCDICGESFRYSQYLKDHVRKEHIEMGMDSLGDMSPSMT